MARKRMEDPSLKSWDEVNAALKLIRDNEIELELIEADMGKKIADIKEQAVPYRDDIKKLELQGKEVVTLNKAELKGKSREMDFGKVGFRMSTKLMLPKKVEKVIKTLKKYGMGDCITVKESVNKDILKTYDEKTILSVGGTLKKEDTFWYETNREELSDPAE